MRIGITGIDGFVGWHLHAFLKSRGCAAVIPCLEKTFQSKEALSDFVSRSDVVVHLAGMNRGRDSELYETNIRLTQQLIEICEEGGYKPHIVFSSSTHIARDTAYGRSKKKCAELFSVWSQRVGAPFTNLILPQLFGECGRPFYNSAISTFCHQVAHKESPTIIQDSELELAHAQQVAEKIWDVIQANKVGDVSVSGVAIRVSSALKKIQALANEYCDGLIPKLETPFDLNLFNTYRSYLFPEYYPVVPVFHEDERGGLFEAIKSRREGQAFISTTKPGITRGNHYHLRKIERFCVIQGHAIIRIRKLFSKEVKEFHVDGNKPVFLDIPTLHTHNITNCGSDVLMTLFWAHEIYNPSNPDTYLEVV
jgi:UDP-2-acetamido-2,6-beta-L-arabino-hexul-4-ose reductase